MEVQHTKHVTSKSVKKCCLGVMPDEQRRSHFDEMGIDHLAEYLGYRVGYLGGPLAPDEAEHYRNQHVQQEYLRSTVTV